MEPKKTPKTRKREKPFPHHVSTYLSDEGLDLLDQLTEKHETSQAELLRRLIRQEAQQQGIRPG